MSVEFEVVDFAAGLFFFFCQHPLCSRQFETHFKPKSSHLQQLVV